MTRRRRDKRIWYILTIVFVAVGFFSFLTQREDTKEVEAASLDKFKAGYIISDYQMRNYNSMTEEQIQSFLTKKNGCKNKDSGLYEDLSGRYSTIHWHFSDGHFVCLSEELFGDGIKYGEDLKKGEGETAAHIIWQAAQDFKINPQVLIVLLEKEQSLITDTYPHSGQYRSATGYGCPDTAPCNEQYYGFKNQVRKAAELFSVVLDGGWTNYPLGNNYIQYNPSASCGGSTVKIENLATSALYRYTPYQPNAAALAAGYGTAECGAYGNRNFYLYFEDWFGGIVDEEAAQNGEDATTPGATEEQLSPKEKAKIEIDKRAKEATILGKAKNKELKALKDGGYYKEFERGYIYWTEKTGAWDVSGGILDLWLDLKKEKGILGYPLSSEKTNKRGEVYQEFENGKIYWTAKKGAWVIRDFAVEVWDGLGGAKSKLGDVTYNGQCGLIKDGCYQAFVTGVIIGNTKTGYFDVSGGIKDLWYQIGAEWGILGYPLSSEKTNKRGEVYQEFENGKIYWTAKKGAWVEGASKE